MPPAQGGRTEILCVFIPPAEDGGMEIMMKESLEQYVENRLPQMKKTLEELVQIPAPSFGERRRAEYCMKWLETNGVSGTYIDPYDNVIVSYPVTDRKLQKQPFSCLFLAHLDTVFPEDTKLELRKEEERWSCPGIGDDTANAVVLMELIRYLFIQKLDIAHPVLFALNTGEEGLGNLKGCRGVMKEYEGQIEAVVAFDLYQKSLYTDCVGSIRYRIDVKTEGGHSWIDFGKANAIERMSAILQELYRYQPCEGSKTTYNAGVIEGGTSVNTIASAGSFLFEYRSESAQAMKHGDAYLRQVLEKYCCGETKVCCTVVGERPCSMDVDPEKQRWLARGISRITEEVTGKRPEEGAASTDCNIPLSFGIPSVCIGLTEGGGAHTREEWIRPSSMKDGLTMAVKAVQFVAGEMEPIQFVSPDHELTEKEKGEIFEILSACDRDFCPPLSERGGTAEKNLTGDNSHNPGVTDYYRELMTQKNFLWKQGGRTIAFLSFRPEYKCPQLSRFPRVCYLTTLCLLKEFRGKGLSVRIYREVLQYLRSRYPDATPALRTWSTNGAQIHLMEKLHFEQVAVLQNDRGPGVDTVYFAKTDVSV